MKPTAFGAVGMQQSNNYLITISTYLIDQVPRAALALPEFHYSDRAWIFGACLDWLRKPIVFLTTAEWFYDSPPPKPVIFFNGRFMAAR